MKSLLLGTAAAVAIALSMSGAGAVDGSKLIAACKASVDNKTLPQGVNGDTYMKFCQCLVTKAGDNQAVIDEHTSIASAKPEEVAAKVAAASPASGANAQACQAETGMTPPPPAPAK